jgi:KUP system potassium uptake protein
VKQRINTKSSCEAELVAASDNLGEAMHLRSFLTDQGHAVDPIILFQDNMATMQLLKNGKFSSIRSKHIDRKYFWIKDQIEKRVVTVQYTPTENMLADLFTKPLQGDKFVGLRNAVMNWNDNV